MTITRISGVLVIGLISLLLSACDEEEGEHESEHHRIVTTSAAVKDVTVTEQYVCQIHSRRHIHVCAMESGYLQEIRINEGQAVKKGDVLFKILPTLYQSKLDAELAEARLARLEYVNTQKLFERKVVSDQEVALYEAKLAKAEAEANLAQAEVNFTNVVAPFDGIVDRLEEQLGSLIEEGGKLTTLSDNSVMWVYFNVPEARYLEYMAEHPTADRPGDDLAAIKQVPLGGPDDRVVAAAKSSENDAIELVLADGSKFPHTGKIGAIEAQFNNETGNIPFRADFPNPDRLLRHGQTGNVLIHRTLKNALVIPQRATFEILDKRYVFVVDEKGIVHQREITVQEEKDDIFVVAKGLDAKEKIVLEGVRQVRDGEHLEKFELRKPEEALANQKLHAE